MPVPSTTGKVMRTSSSTRSRAISDWVSTLLPITLSGVSPAAFNSSTSARPLSRTELSQPEPATEQQVGRREVLAHELAGGGVCLGEVRCGPATEREAVGRVFVG